MSRATLLAVLAAAVLAGCGSEEQAAPPVQRDLPAITSPDTGIPYEQGGGDGSGADGNAGDRDPERRGGVAAGPDGSDERK